MIVTVHNAIKNDKEGKPLKMRIPFHSILVFWRSDTAPMTYVQINTVKDKDIISVLETEDEIESQINRLVNQGVKKNGTRRNSTK